MILDETINKLLRDIVSNIIDDEDYTVIKAKQTGAPRPIGAYADIDFISMLALGQEQRAFTNNSGDDDMTETIQGMREYGASIGFYRTGATDYANAVHIGFARQSVLDLFAAAKIGFTRASDVREVSEALEDGWEERAQFDIYLNLVGTDSDIVRSIKTLSIAGQSQSNNQTYNFNIENQ